MLSERINFMTRKVFTSFHYTPDNWRASQIRSMDKLECNSLASSNNWKEVTESGNQAIKDWINNKMDGKACLIVFIGKNTAGRKWIQYEILKAWDDGLGVIGIYVHNLKDSDGDLSIKGSNPFADFSVNEKKLSSVIKCYDPPFKTSSYVYDYIKDNIEDWIEEAIVLRNDF